MRKKHISTLIQMLKRLAHSHTVSSGTEFNKLLNQLVPLSPPLFLFEMEKQTASRNKSSGTLPQDSKTQKQ